MVALIVMRYTKPNYPRPYKVIGVGNKTMENHYICSSLYISGADYHSVFGFDRISVFSYWPDYRQSANRVPVCADVYISRTYFLFAIC